MKTRTDKIRDTAFMDRVATLFGNRLQRRSRQDVILDDGTPPRKLQQHRKKRKQKNKIAKASRRRNRR